MGVFCDVCVCVCVCVCVDVCGCVWMWMCVCVCVYRMIARVMSLHVLAYICMSCCRLAQVCLVYGLV
jgi:hypothetical protein